jgi:cysteine desulfuration protein SufE
MQSSIDASIAALRAQFSGIATAHGRYEKIIELGRSMTPLADQFKQPQFRVAGCQSRLYLRSFVEGELIFFEAEADALIANGLAYLLITVYSQQRIEEMLRHSPTYLEELQIPGSLSMSRANGLASLHLRMKRDALRLLIDWQKRALAGSPGALH